VTSKSLSSTKPIMLLWGDVLKFSIYNSVTDSTNIVDEDGKILQAGVEENPAINLDVTGSVLLQDGYMLVFFRNLDAKVVGFYEPVKKFLSYNIHGDLIPAVAKSKNGFAVDVGGRNFYAGKVVCNYKPVEP